MDWLKKAVSNKSKSWWFGENSLWGKSGLSNSVKEGTDEGISNLFNGGIKTKNEVNLGTQEKFILLAIVIAMVIIKK